MNFNVIVGNPPYQDSNGGGGNGKSASALYHIFIKIGLELKSDILIMITPNKWLKDTNNCMWNIRKEILTNRKIEYIKTYSNSWDVFPSVGNIAGGVGYMLITTNHKHSATTILNDIHGKEIKAINIYTDKDEIICTDSIGINITKKIWNIETNTNRLSEVVSQTNPFGIASNDKGDNNLTEDYCTVITSNGKIKKSIYDIYKNTEIMKTYKVLTSKYAPSGGFADCDGKFKVISKSMVLEPYEICSQSYIVIGPVETKEEAERLKEFIKLKIVRFLMLMALTGMSISQDTFRYVPWLNFKNNYTDKELYTKYKLSVQEIEYIDSMIKDI